MPETPLCDPHGTCAENREAWQVRMQGPKDIMINGRQSPENS